MTKPPALVVVAHKPCVIDTDAGGEVFTDGGFPAQMRALAKRFGGATILVPCTREASPTGLTPLEGYGIRVVPLTEVPGRKLVRKLLFPLWCLRNLVPLWSWVRRARGVHAVIPGDVGTAGLALAYLGRKPLLIRHCGNWTRPVTRAEKLWRGFMERTAGGRTACLATGGGTEPPSETNAHVKWIFSSSLSRAELEACHERGRKKSGRTRRLIIVCRQERRKGTGLVLEALARLVKDGHDLRLTVVGDGSALPAFRAEALGLGLQDRVDFVGQVPQAEVMAHLETADVFVFPTSASEGFPKVVLEALAMGRPVITTKVSVLPHLLAGGGGLILPETTSEEIVTAVASLYEQPETLARVGAEAMVVSDAFSSEAWAEIMYQALEGAIRGDVEREA